LKDHLIILLISRLIKQYYQPFHQSKFQSLPSMGLENAGLRLNTKRFKIHFTI